MARTAEDRRTDAPAPQEPVRRGVIARLARTMAGRTRSARSPQQPEAGRRRVWSAPT